MQEKLQALIKKHSQAVQTHFRWLHAHPELSGQEQQTAAYITSALRDMGLEPQEGVGGYGVVALIRGNAPGRCVALRADMDALPIMEATDLPYISQNPGVMHACGHDAHVSMLLGAALVLNELKDHFAGCVKLIFQPSEENSADSGAKRMIADGVLENPHVDAIMGQHIDALADTGTISSRPGVASAASDRFTIEVEGVASHVARPHLGTDAIVVAAQIITALQTVVSRNTDPRKSAVIGIGQIQGGERYNVVPSFVTMGGTCRTLDPDTRNLVERRMGETVNGIAEAMGAKCTLRYSRGYPSIMNRPELVELVRQAAVPLCGVERVIIPKEVGMGAEDFSFYTEHVPAVYFKTGCHKPGTPRWSSHNEHMVVDPDCLPIGMQVLTTCALLYLEGK